MTRLAATTTSDAMVVEVVEPARYFGDAEAWDAMVRRCGADPLFMGHAWQSQWWAAFAPLHGLTPCFLEFRRGGVIRGRASLFRRPVRIKRLPFRSLELLGNLWRGPATFRSEFLDVLAEPDDRQAVTEAFLYWLREERDWDLMPAMDLAADGLLAPALESAPAFAGMCTHEAEASSFEVRIEGTLEDYRASLSQNARRKMFGQRRKLQDALGPLALLQVHSLDELDRLHALRWGSPLLHGGRVEFLHGLRGALPVGAMHVSLLRAGAENVSALLNVRIAGERLYNLQGGFSAAACESVSPARLHWGMVIEEEFTARSVACIDLLLGVGRSDDYKREIARAGRAGIALLTLRNPVLRGASRVRELLRPSRGGGGR